MAVHEMKTRVLRTADDYRAAIHEAPDSTSREALERHLADFLARQEARQRTRHTQEVA